MHFDLASNCAKLAPTEGIGCTLRTVSCPLICGVPKLKGISLLALIPILSIAVCCAIKGGWSYGTTTGGRISIQPREKGFHANETNTRKCFSSAHGLEAEWSIQKIIFAVCKRFPTQLGMACHVPFCSKSKSFKTLFQITPNSSKLLPLHASYTTLVLIQRQTNISR